MKRAFVRLIVATGLLLGLMAPATVWATGSEPDGDPPTELACADFLFTAFPPTSVSYFVGTDTSGNPALILRARMHMEAASCKSVIYTVHVQSADGTTPIATYSRPGDDTNAVLTFAKVLPGDPSNPPVICVFMATSHGVGDGEGNQLDRAPTTSCNPIQPGNSGGGRGFW
jgi:hypothetical protein